MCWRRGRSTPRQRTRQSEGLPPLASAAARCTSMVCTLAAAEMYGMDPDLELETGCGRRCADRANAVAQGGWRYPAPDNQDLSVTVMQIVSLRAANNAEFLSRSSRSSNCLRKSCSYPAGGFGGASRAGRPPRLASCRCNFSARPTIPGIEDDEYLKTFLRATPKAHGTCTNSATSTTSTITRCKPLPVWRSDIERLAPKVRDALADEAESRMVAGISPRAHRKRPRRPEQRSTRRQWRVWYWIFICTFAGVSKVKRALTHLHI